MPKGLGRIHHPDSRDRNYPLMAVADTADVPWDELPTYKYYYVPRILDQDETPHCVGFSWRTWLYNGPIQNKAPEPSADDIYYWAEANDPWPDNHEQGTTVRAGVRALLSYGDASEYRWAETVEEMVRWLATGKGPLVVGTDWLVGMDRPDSKDFVHATGSVRGGHAYGITGYNRHEQKFRLTNNWGVSWADGGKAWISFADFAHLLADGGEACCALEVKV